MVSAAAEWDELNARLDLARDAVADLYDQITTAGARQAASDLAAASEGAAPAGGNPAAGGAVFAALANARTTVTVAAGLLDEVALLVADGESKGAP